MDLIAQAVQFAVDNPEAAGTIAVTVTGAVTQGVSVAVKHSPWGWDDHLWSWIKKNKAGFSFVFKLLIKNKSKR